MRNEKFAKSNFIVFVENGVVDDERVVHGGSGEGLLCECEQPPEALGHHATAERSRRKVKRRVAWDREHQDGTLSIIYHLISSSHHLVYHPSFHHFIVSSSHLHQIINNIQLAFFMKFVISCSCVCWSKSVACSPSSETEAIKTLEQQEHTLVVYAIHPELKKWLVIAFLNG